MGLGIGREARFNRYFEGYEKRTFIDRNGEERTKFVYTKEYYQPKMSNGAFTARKVLNVVIFLAAGAAQLFSGLMSGCPMNSLKYMGFAQCLGILAMILMAVYICIHMAAPYTMEIHSYRGAHEKFSIAALIVTVGMAAIFITALVSMIICHASGFTNIVWCAMYFIAAALFFLMWFLEKKTDYDILPPDHQF